MVTVSYPLERSRIPDLPAQIREQIHARKVEAIEQKGVHETYVVDDGMNVFFFKDYTIAKKPAHMLAEWIAHTRAGRTAPLHYREPLGGFRADPGERSQREARTLRQWSAIGIDAPRVIAYDGTGLILERIPGRTLAEHLVEGSLEQRHIDRYYEHIHTGREAALTIEDPSYLHNDPTLANAIATREHVYLFDPGIITKPLDVRDLDAAISVYHLAGLEALAEETMAMMPQPQQDRTLIDEQLDALAHGYLSGTGPRARQQMLEVARPVPSSLINAMTRVPHGAFRGYARWLSYFNEEKMERIVERIKNT